MSVIVPLERQSYLREYLAQAPIALALERSLECEVFRGRPFRKPILDIGCGDGLFAEVLFGSGRRICYGLDPNRHELSEARRRGVYKALLHCKGDSIPLADGFCRTIFSNSVLEHIPEIGRVFREIYRVLRADGELMLTVPTDKFGVYTVGRQLLKRLALGGAAEAFSMRFNRFWRLYHCYPPEEWKALLGKFGFETAEIVEYAPKGVCLFKDAMVPFAFPSFVIKKLFNRWILFSSFRNRLANVLCRLLQDTLRVGCADGGLVFLRAVKSTAKVWDG